MLTKQRTPYFHFGSLQELHSEHRIKSNMAWLCLNSAFQILQILTMMTLHLLYDTRIGLQILTALTRSYGATTIDYMVVFSNRNMLFSHSGDLKGDWSIIIPGPWKNHTVASDDRNLIDLGWGHMYCSPRG